MSGIILIHEWWGLNEYIKREAERLHEATGYGVVAVDLYNGKTTTDPEEAHKLMQAIDPKFAAETLKVAAGQIKRGAILGRKMKKCGVIGFCLGGTWSLQTAIAAGKDADACVMYYGFPETDPTKLAKITAPVLGIFANQDAFIKPSIVDRFAEDMKAAGKQLTLRRYDADHAFANPSNPKYDKKNAEAAWREAIGFLTRYLRV